MTEPEQNDGPFQIEPDGETVAVPGLLINVAVARTLRPLVVTRFWRDRLNDAYRLGHDAAQSAAAGTLRQLESELRTARRALLDADERVNALLATVRGGTP